MRGDAAGHSGYRESEGTCEERGRREIPVPDARVKISYTGDPGDVLEEIKTDETGQTQTVELRTPPVEYSLEPSETQPYSEYTLQISAPGYESATITGAEILSSQTSIQEVWLRPLSQGQAPDVITIPEHTLYGSYPPKIAEAELKPMDTSGGDCAQPRRRSGVYCRTRRFPQGYDGAKLLCPLPGLHQKCGVE